MDQNRTDSPSINEGGFLMNINFTKTKFPTWALVPAAAGLIALPLSGHEGLKDQVIPGMEDEID